MRFLLLAFALPTFAWATLGEGRASIERDEMVMSGKRVVAQSSVVRRGVQVYVSKVEAVTIRQFVDSNDLVFAIAWNGLHYPDLSPLLGKFYTEYAVADAMTLKGRKYPRRPVDSKNFVLRRSGHMPNLRGYIFLKDRMPPGWSEENLL